LTPRTLIILGSTGSIGTQAIDVVRHAAREAELRGEPAPLRIVGLAAGSNARLLGEQARACGVRSLALRDEQGAIEVLANTTVLRGTRSAEELIATTPCDIVLAAMVGSAGLPATLLALGQGRTVALANKETLVAAGSVMLRAARESKGSLRPVDSEHAALWQCLVGSGGQRGSSDTAPPHVPLAGVSRAILTASGGPFRTWSKDAIETATPEQALRHPTWSMGSKVTIDSAGLMNKALELIEAHWLFGLRADQLSALIHPQSIVHAIVEMRDGSSVAQLAPADMRIPIQRALLWPLCSASPAPPLDWTALRTLQFEAPDLHRFPALGFADHVMRVGGTSGAVMNAANEVAVEAFLRGGMPFGEIARVVEHVLHTLVVRPAETLAQVHAADAEAREVARSLLGKASPARG
jgi:1-deoxy-D-xylulose-5-phosphate reductoisomerase